MWGYLDTEIAELKVILLIEINHVTNFNSAV